MSAARKYPSHTISTTSNTYSHTHKIILISALNAPDAVVTTVATTAAGDVGGWEQTPSLEALNPLSTASPSPSNTKMPLSPPSPARTMTTWFSVSCRGKIYLWAEMEGWMEMDLFCALSRIREWRVSGHTRFWLNSVRTSICHSNIY